MRISIIGPAHPLRGGIAHHVYWLRRELATRMARLDRFYTDKIASIAPPRKTGPLPAKYCNPKDPRETWAGRGKQPRWLRTQLRSGKKLDDFRIKQGQSSAF